MALLQQYFCPALVTQGDRAWTNLEQEGLHSSIVLLRPLMQPPVLRMQSHSCKACRCSAGGRPTFLSQCKAHELY